MRKTLYATFAAGLLSAAGVTTAEAQLGGALGGTQRERHHRRRTRAAGVGHWRGGLTGGANAGAGAGGTLPFARNHRARDGSRRWSRGVRDDACAEPDARCARDGRRCGECIRQCGRRMPEWQRRQDRRRLAAARMPMRNRTATPRPPRPSRLSARQLRLANGAARNASQRVNDTSVSAGASGDAGASGSAGAEGEHRAARPCVECRRFGQRKRQCGCSLLTWQASKDATWG